MFDGGLSGSTQVGQAKDIPLAEESGENTHTHTHTDRHTHVGGLVCARAQRLLLGSRRQGVFGFAVKREMNKTIESGGGRFE